jgi:hypothetical protein
MVEIDKVVGDPPAIGDEVTLTPFDFLAPFRSKWLGVDASELVGGFERWIAGAAISDPSECVHQRALEVVECHQALAPSQREAFRLLDQQCGFLWGPPGTGKTHTLAAMVAGFVLQNRKAKICIMATRHAAVDQLLVSVDKILEKACGAGDRPKAARLGTFFDAGILRERPHLRPGMSPELMDRLSSQEFSRPDARSGEIYQRWKDELDGLWSQARSQMEGVLETSAIVACTTAFAGLRMLDLDSARFDLIVIDESSLLSLPQCLLLGRLGTRVVFAGDPRQLAPISLAATEGRSRRGRGAGRPSTAPSDQARRARSEFARRWMARSILDWLPIEGSPATAQLIEQGRMSVEVMEIVSRLFYDGRLVLGPWVAGDACWQNRRAIEPTSRFGTDRVIALEAGDDAMPGESGRGQRRPSSAEAIAHAVREMILAGTREILVVTPFRDQVMEIKSALRRVNRSVPHGVDVRTIHRAQGLERHTVIFDPVNGGHFTLTSQVSGSRAVNVALSRAMARLVVAVSEQDALQNPLLALVRARSRQVAR